MVLIIAVGTLPYNRIRIIVQQVTGSICLFLSYLRHANHVHYDTFLQLVHSVPTSVLNVYFFENGTTGTGLVRCILF